MSDETVIRTSNGSNDLTDEDAANIGRALMERLPPGYSWSDCPTEIVTDLSNQVDDLRAMLAETIEYARQTMPTARYRLARLMCGGVVHNSPSDETCDALDAARYRYIRQGEDVLSPEDEEHYAEMWKVIWLKGCDCEKMDAVVDAAMAKSEAANTQKASEGQS